MITQEMTKKKITKKIQKILHIAKNIRLESLGFAYWSGLANFD